MIIIIITFIIIIIIVLRILSKVVDRFERNHKPLSKKEFAPNFHQELTTNSLSQLRKLNYNRHLGIDCERNRSAIRKILLNYEIIKISQTVKAPFDLIHCV